MNYDNCSYSDIGHDNGADLYIIADGQPNGSACPVYFLEYSDHRSVAEIRVDAGIASGLIPIA